jgi:NTE family protein
MKIPLGIVATDLDSGRAILFRRGDLGTAVRASSAVPAVFQPVRIGTHEYVDGGLASPVPVRSAREMGADVVIAVDISQLPDGGATGDALHMLLQTFSIMSRSINELELKEADVVLHPKLTGVAGTDFSLHQKNIQAGRDAALAMLPAIKAKATTPVPLAR